MSQPNWEAIKLAFESGMANRKISEEHGVPESTIRKYAKREGWEKPSKPSNKSVRKSRAQGVRKATDEHECAHPDITAVIKAVDDVESAYGLTPRAARFVIEYLTDRNGTQAVMRAGYAESGASVQASRLLSNAKVRRAIDEQVQAQMARTLITQDWVLGQWAAIATADPGEVSQLRIGCCRHCHGIDHGYQYVDDAEYQEAQHAAEAKGCDLPAFGGYGYARHITPAADCPMCGGEGVRRQYLADTRSLSPQARLLFDGVDQTKDGIKVKVRDRDAALAYIAKHLGMLSNSKLELTGKDGGPVEHAVTLSPDKIKSISEALEDDC